MTGFFRAPEAFQTLEAQVLPKLLAGKPASAVIRIWSPGCSTGEEAYSLAMLLGEREQAAGSPERLTSCAIGDFDTFFPRDRGLSTLHASLGNAEIVPAGLLLTVS